jgi:Zn-dependent peptidase ImmA (M78 family)
VGWVNPESEADRVLFETGSPRLPNGIAIDVERIIRNNCDIDVAVVPDLSIDGQDLAGLYSPTHKVVMVEAKDKLPRRRFTLGHELGHIEIHHNTPAMQPLFELDPEKTSYRCTASDLAGTVADARRRTRETIANRFAAALLMPKGLVQEVWAKTRDVEETASALVVSVQAMQIRLEQLGAKR